MAEKRCFSRSVYPLKVFAVADSFFYLFVVIYLLLNKIILDLGKNRIQFFINKNLKICEVWKKKKRGLFATVGNLISVGVLLGDQDNGYQKSVSLPFFFRLVIAPRGDVIV